MCEFRKFQLVLALVVTASQLLSCEANVALRLGSEPLFSPLYRPSLLPAKPSPPREYNVPASEPNSDVDYFEFNSKNSAVKEPPHAIKEPALSRESSQSLPSFAVSDKKLIVHEPAPEIRVPTHISPAQRPVEVRDSQFAYIQPQRPQQPQQPQQQFANIQENRFPAFHNARPEMPFFVKPAELPPQRLVPEYENALLHQKKLQPEINSPKEADVFAYQPQKAHNNGKPAEPALAPVRQPQSPLHAAKPLQQELFPQHSQASSDLSVLESHDQEPLTQKTTAVKETAPKTDRREGIHVTVIIEGPQFDKQPIHQTSEVLDQEHGHAVNVTVVVKGNGNDTNADGDRPSVVLATEEAELEAEAEAGDKHESVTLEAEPDKYEYDAEEMLSQADLLKRQQAQNIMALPTCAYDVAYLPHPSDCRRFIQCIDGNAMEMECMQHLFWDGVLNVCGKSSANCFGKPQVPKEPKVTEQQNVAAKYLGTKINVQKEVFEEQPKHAQHAQSRPELKYPDYVYENHTNREHKKEVDALRPTLSEQPSQKQLHTHHTKEMEPAYPANKLPAKEQSLEQYAEEILSAHKILTKEAVVDGSKRENEPETVKKAPKKFTIVIFTKNDENEEKKEENPDTVNQEIKKFTLTKEVEIDENEEKDEEKQEAVNQAIKKFTLTKEVEIDEYAEELVEQPEALKETANKFTQTKEVEIYEEMTNVEPAIVKP